MAAADPRFRRSRPPSQVGYRLLAEQLITSASSSPRHPRLLFWLRSGGGGSLTVLAISARNVEAENGNLPHTILVQHDAQGI